MFNDQPFSVIDGTQDIVASVIADVRKAVVATMGPNGTLSLISIGVANKVTKDGVTVARSIKFNDPIKERINRVITEPAIKTDQECGDGTTTTILLTSELYPIFRKHAGYRDQAYVEKVMRLVVQELTGMAIKVQLDSPELFKLALTSSNNDEELSRIVTQIYAESGEHFPEVELREGSSNTDRVVRSNGLPIKMQFSNPSFSNTGNGGDTNYHGFFPVIIDDNLRGMSAENAMRALSAIYNKLIDEHKLGHIMLIARSIDNSLGNIMLTINSQHQSAKFVGVQTNFGGSIGTLLMQDIAVMFNAPLFKTMEDALTKDIPIVNEVVTVGSTRSIIADPLPETRERINARVVEIEEELAGYDREDRFSTRARFNETRARDLKGELVTVFVGGETGSEVKERLDRFEDVIKAVKSALVNGILPGVGTSLYKAGMTVIDRLEDAFIDSPDPKLTPNAGQILTDLEDVFRAGYLHLMTGPLKDHDIPLPNDTAYLPCVNLATGQVGTAEDLGIYDTAFASITALKGGIQTAKILANIESIMIGDKLAAVQIQN
jgi:chaperonin GroEL